MVFLSNKPYHVNHHSSEGLTLVCINMLQEVAVWLLRGEDEHRVTRVCELYIHMKVQKAYLP